MSAAADVAAARPGAGAPEPRRVAAAAGLAGARDGLVTDLGSSHEVHRVDAVGGSVVVKALGSTAREKGRALAAEAFAYRLGTWRTGLAAVMPRARLIDEGRGVVVIDAAPVQNVGAWLLDAARLPSVPASVALGRALATVHNATAGVPIPFAASAGILDLPGSSAIGLVRAAHLSAAIATDPVLAPALTRARSGWQPSCLVHGDVKWDNCLVDLDRLPPEVLLIDWELSGWGDPAWDVATFVAQAGAHEIAGGPAAEPYQQALVASYTEAGGPAALERVARYWPARLVHLALECAEGGAPAVAESLLDAARDLARNAAENEVRVWEWTG